MVERQQNSPSGSREREREREGDEVTKLYKFTIELRLGHIHVCKQSEQHVCGRGN